MMILRKSDNKYYIYLYIYIYRYEEEIFFFGFGFGMSFAWLIQQRAFLPRDLHIYQT